MFAFCAALPLGARPAIPPAIPPAAAAAAAAAACRGVLPPAAAVPSARAAARRRADGARMSTATPPASGQDVRITLTGNNIAITESLREYVDAKIGKIVRKHASICTKVDVHLSVEHNPAIAAKNAAEVVVFAGKTILRRQVRAVDMYEAIDQVEDMLGRTLRKFKERKEGRHQKAPSEKDPASSVVSDVPEDSQSDSDEPEDRYASVPAQKSPVNGVVKRKVFPMPLQTVEEAILCLEYIDHSFYLFRLKETGRVSLVYRRNHGGYGIIEPENPDVEDES